MTKKNLLNILLKTIFIIAFNVLFFLNVEFKQSPSVWICYGFVHFAYLMIILIQFIETNEYISKTTSYTVSIIYFVVELVFSLIIFIPKVEITTKVTLSIQVIITAIYLFLFIINLLANDTISNKQYVQNIQNDFIKSISAKTKYVESIVNSEKVKSRVNNLYYTIHSSPTKTCEDVSFHEEKIIELINSLEISAEQNDEVALVEQIIEIERLVNKRNFILKSKK